MRRGTRAAMRKLLNSLITLMLVIVVNFILFRMMPGDPVNIVVPSDPRIPSEYKEQLIEDYGLNDSMLGQFFTYLKCVFTLDFGN